MGWLNLKIVKAISILVFGLLCFASGSFWSNMQIIESNPVRLTQPLTVQLSPDQLGIIPKGTTLYQYSSGPSTETYVLFINSKNLSVVEPVVFQNFMTIDPLDGYIITQK